MPIKKPTLDDALNFAESKKPVSKSGQVPPGKKRFTANIRADLHLKFKIKAAKRDISMGELFEELIEAL